MVCVGVWVGHGKGVSVWPKAYDTFLISIWCGNWFMDYLWVWVWVRNG